MIKFIFTGISPLQSSFGDEVSVDTPLQSPTKQEEVQLIRCVHYSCYLFNYALTCYSQLDEKVP